MSLITDTDIAVWFDHGGGTTTFTMFEVLNLQVKNVQAEDRFEKQNTYFHQYKTNQGYKHFVINFRRDLKTTFSKVETLFNRRDSYYQPEKMNFFYKNKLSPATYAKVQMQRQTFSEILFKGYQKFQTITVEFTESNS